MKNTPLYVSVLLHTAFCTSLLTGCTGSDVEAGASLDDPGIEEPSVLEDSVRVTGEFCTAPTPDAEYPLKILYLIDSSTSLQCTAPGLDVERVLRTAVETAVSKNPGPTEFAFVNFSSFVRMQDLVDDDGASSYLLGLASMGLGPASDYQGGSQPQSISSRRMPARWNLPNEHELATS